MGPSGALSQEQLRQAASAAKSRKIIAFPTDTVYGIGCTGLVKAAMRRIYEIKGREAMKPLPILVHSSDEAGRWVEWTPQARALASRFWPGPLTLVLRPTKEGRLLSFQGFPTLAIRVPNHPVALALLREAGPMATTSANLSGRPALASGEQVAAEFANLVDLVIDAGPVPGKESSIVDASGPAPRVLREGALRRQELLEAAA